MKVTAIRSFAAFAALALAPAIGHSAVGPEVHSVEEATSRWAQVLERFVNHEGRVNYVALSKDRADLDAYVEWVGAVSPESHPDRFGSRQAVLAYHINAYNALAMHGILASDLPQSIGGLRKYFFFGVRGIRVGGRDMTLYSYENDIIRPLGEPRVHFALNCMAISCPILPREPFEATTIDSVLDRETRNFFSEDRNFLVDHEARIVKLSEILNFFPEDFVDEKTTLIDFVNRYLGTPVPRDYEVRFFKYDWTVNHQASN